MKKPLKNMTLLFLALVTTAQAASDVQAVEAGLLVWGFIAFAGLIVINQLIPGLILFFGMLKGLFAAGNRAF